MWYAHVGDNNMLYVIVYHASVVHLCIILICCNRVPYLRRFMRLSAMLECNTCVPYLYVSNHISMLCTPVRGSDDACVHHMKLLSACASDSGGVCAHQIEMLSACASGSDDVCVHHISMLRTPVSSVY